ncbi:MAG: rhamnan synthesis F family protein [Actinomycetota bacterium]|nr:rhamnan synthesis F family protein [Actinomycetota bacterium]
MRRVVFYLFYDAHGVVDDYVLHKLRALRQHAEHIFVVSNSILDDDGRARLEQVADTILVRENIGFDVWAYREALEAFGDARLAEYDELVLTNYTYFGPIYPFRETFDRFDRKQDLDFWGLTAHKRVGVNPLAAEGDDGPLEAHIQSHWIAVRRTLFTAVEFAEYWRTMPAITSYLDSIRYHEARFTKHFADRGFRYEVAFPADDYPADNPVMDCTGQMLDNRCPIVKRRVFFHEPLYMDRQGVLGKRVLEKITEAGYPAELIWSNLVPSTEPRTLYTNLAMLSVLPDLEPSGRPQWQPRICVMAHIYYVDMIAELMGAIGNIPVPFDLVATTDTQAKQDAIAQALRDYPINKVEVRVVESNSGRSESAFLITCRDVLTSGSYDLILKVHSKKSPQDGYNSGSVFKNHTIDNLLSSPGYIAHLLQLFELEPKLGMVIPPLIHIGFPTLGHSWFGNFEPAAELAKTLDIRTPFDPSTPLSANGGMFWARPEALTKLARHPFEFTDFVPNDEGWRDGQLPHVLERLYSYAAIDAGYLVRVVANADWAAIDYTLLEYKMQRISSMLPAHPYEQIAYIVGLQQSDKLRREYVPPRPLAAFLESMSAHYPRIAGTRLSQRARSRK